MIKNIEAAGIDQKFDLSLLNEKEKTYFRLIYPKSGVLFLTSEPGLAKSAIMRTIAKKIKIKKCLNPNYIGKNLRYIDLRLSMLDETDVGLYPSKKEIEVDIYDNNGKKISTRKQEFLTHIIPEWAHIANTQPTLINFEELNRAQLTVRNASLQILLEREIGYNFGFNEDVYMCSTGNLGEEDDTDVEEFDASLNGRLIHKRHTMTKEEWFNAYAIEHVQEIIIDFIRLNPEYYYISKDARNENTKSFATPRTWTFLSDYITENYGFNSDYNLWVDDIRNNGSCFIGFNANLKLVKWLEDSQKISIDNILDNYIEVKANNSIIDKDGKKVLILRRDRKSELITKFNNFNLLSLKGKSDKIENLKLFLLDISKDEVVSFLMFTIEKYLSEEKDYSRINDDEKFIIQSFFKDSRFDMLQDEMYSITTVVDEEFKKKLKEK